MKDQKETVEEYLRSPNVCQHCNEVIKVKATEKPSTTRKRKFCRIQCCNYFKGIKSREQALENYYKNPNKCRNCHEVIHVKEDTKVSQVKIKVFCGQSCSAQYNNKQGAVDRYTQDPNKCLECDKAIEIKGNVTQTRRKKFCDLSCAGIFNGRLPRYGLSHKCRMCNTLILSRLSYCGHYCRKLYRKLHKGKIPKRPKPEIEYRRQKKRHEVKKQCIEYKGGRCDKCGYDKSLGALEFHHVNPKEKKYQIGYGIARTWDLEKMKPELDKCQLVCSNCHKEIHHEARLQRLESSMGL